MRGAKDEAVVVHRKSFATKQMWQIRLAQRVKNVDYKQNQHEERDDH
jgi:hypothetical protein